jgi:transposase-like protein
MKEAKIRKSHNSELKAKVALEALRGVKMVNEIGIEFGVHPGQVGLWKRELQKQAKTLFEGVPLARQCVLAGGIPLRDLSGQETAPAG